MRPGLLSRKLHKWLTLFVGVQLVIWTLSGFYMVVVDLDFIHGDPLVRNLRVALPLDAPKVSIAEVVRRYPGVTNLSVHSLGSSRRPVIELATPMQKVLVDANTGKQLSPLSEALVRELANTYYSGSAPIRSVALLERDRPMEIQTRALPLWRVDFDDWLATSFYVDPDTGALVTRRHRFWRWFDFVWMLHIMDYDTREDMNNPLLRVFTVSGVVTVISGAWLLYFSFRRKPVRARTAV
jgi:uncharacterized iron-regulated membrane protein